MATQDEEPVSAGPFGLHWSAIAVPAACLAAALGGTMAVATRSVIDETDPLTLSMVRYGLAALCILPLAIRAGDWRIPRGDLKYILALGMMFFGLFPIGFSSALTFTTASRGALVLALMPMFTLILNVLIGREKLSLAKVAGVSLVIAGVALVTRNGASAVVAPDAWKGDLIMAGMALLGAVFNVFFSPFARRHSMSVLTFLNMAAGWVFMFILHLFLHPPGQLIPSFSTEGWLTVLYLATLGGALPIFLFNWALGRATATQVSVTIGLNPLTAVFLAALLLGEPLTVIKLCALLLVIGGIVSTSGLFSRQR